MDHVCAHCGEMFGGKRLNCPHCGAEADLTWSDDSEGFDDPRMDDEEYGHFLQEEGLAPKPRGKGCALPALLLSLLILLILL